MRDYLYVVVVTGGRDYADRARVFSYLDAITFLYGGDIVLIHGACPTGADAFADEWATAREQICVRIPAQWKREGKKAGVKRNAEMAAFSNATAVMVFRGGRGTVNMHYLATQMDPQPSIILPDGEFWK